MIIIDIYVGHPHILVVWAVMMWIQGKDISSYLPFLCGLILIACVSFWDDIHSLPDSVRLVAQFTSTALMFWSMGLMHWRMWWIVVLALIVCVGAINIFNFMDGINGITAGYSLAIMIPLLLLNREFAFVEESYLRVALLGVLLFGYFNFRPKGKARCFAGDVGSISIAYILLFAIGRLVLRTGDVTYLIFMLVYGIDGCLTILHRIILRDNLGEAHRKHAFQLMANELRISHVTVSSFYLVLQLIVSLGFIYLCPDSILAHWLYLAGVTLVLVLAYLLFMKKYYYLHEEYLKSLGD